MRKKRRNSNVRIVDERNAKMRNDVWADVDTLIEFVSDLDIEDADKNYILDGVTSMAEFTTALLDAVELPKQRLVFNRDRNAS